MKAAARVFDVNEMRRAFKASEPDSIFRNCEANP